MKKVINLWRLAFKGSLVVLSLVFFNLIQAEKIQSPSSLPILSWFGIEKQSRDLKGRNFRIPGFMIPLEMSGDQRGSSEFLFVPSLMACLHVLPPPPGMTLYVKMKGSGAAELSVELLWLKGRFLESSSQGDEKKRALSKTEASKGAIGKDRAEFAVEGLSVARVTEEEQGVAHNALPQLPNSIFDCHGRDKYEPVCSGEQSVPSKKRDKAAF